MWDDDRYRNACNSISKLVRIGRGGIYIGGYDLLGSTIFGNQMVIDSRHEPSLKNLYVPPPVEISVLALLMNIIKQGMTCIDIGAGCGYYTIILSSIIYPHGKIYSFESIPECFHLLQKNIRLNELEGVICENRLISDRTKQTKQEYFGGNYQFYFLNAEAQKKKEIELETLSIDAYMDDKESCIDFVKINLEDQVPFIIKGMDFTIKMNSHIKLLIAFNKLQIVKGGSDPSQFIDELTAYGFDIFLLPNLNKINKDELLGFSITKQILVARDHSAQ